MCSKAYRDTGAIGAILDEYEKAIQELTTLIDSISDMQLLQIVDRSTEDADCVSIQSILTHVVYAGYCYAIDVRKWLGEKVSYPAQKTYPTAANYQDELRKMFNYNEQLFRDYPNIQLEETDNEKKIYFAWGQCYDVEQIFEHAIVHILRHRRQIERFLLKIAHKKQR